MEACDWLKPIYVQIFGELLTHLLDPELDSVQQLRVMALQRLILSLQEGLASVAAEHLLQFGCVELEQPSLDLETELFARFLVLFVHKAPLEHFIASPDLLLCQFQRLRAKRVH